MPWTTVLLAEAEEELRKLPRLEANAMKHAIEKLEAIGPDLPFPHSSAVKGVEDLRELRPRAGRSPWRGFYRKIRDTLVVAAIGPEADHDRRGFDRSVTDALERLNDLEED